MSDKSTTPRNRRLAKLEQALIRASMVQYPKWVKKWGEPKPWGHPQCVKTKSGWNLIMAAKALYEARRGK